MGAAASAAVAAPYDYAPIAAIALIGALLALGPVAWVWHRERGRDASSRLHARLHALTVLTLTLTFELVLFGAFTRLTDSGLGCPDWPGCYGSASPLGAHARIGAAQSALPDGAVTHGKAWIEMTHRYLATGVGGLITVLVVLAWWGSRATSAEGSAQSSVELSAQRLARGPARSPWWPTATLLWVCVQGAFGAWTVTLKLYPLIVTLHLLGGMVLLALLAAQTQIDRRATLSLPGALHTGLLALAALSAVQIALGGWVSTNYAVLACGADFPGCMGSAWPTMDFGRGYTMLRGLGVDAEGASLPFAALTAIHYVHRLVAYAVLAGMVAFAWRLWALDEPALRPWARGTLIVAAWQLGSGLSNVVLGWPLLGAVAHTAGAAAWVVLLAGLITRARRAP